MNRVQSNIALHYDRLMRTAGTSVIYIRSNIRVHLRSIAAQSNVRVEDGDGVSVYSKRRDWIIKAFLLSTGGIPSPTIGDTILVVVGGRRMTYEVQRIAGEDCFYPVDDRSTYLRVHTRLIKTENV